MMNSLRTVTLLLVIAALAACNHATQTETILLEITGPTCAKLEREHTINTIRKRLEATGINANAITVSNETDGMTNMSVTHSQAAINWNQILRSGGKIGMWETWENDEVYPILDQINQELAEKTLRTAQTEAEAATDLLAELDNPVAPTSTDASHADSIALRNPLFVLLNPVIANMDGYSVLQPGPAVGISLAADTATVNAMLASTTAQELTRPDIAFRWGARQMNDDRDDPIFYLYAIKMSYDGTPPINPNYIEEATATADALGNPAVDLTMTPVGARRWAELTRNNVGKSVAICIDQAVYSAPQVMAEIPGGISNISNVGTEEEAADLASVINSGALTCDVKIVNHEVVQNAE